MTAATGDGDAASRLLIPGVSSVNVREFAAENADDDLRIRGGPQVVENQITYPIIGTEMGEYRAYIRASLTVWMIVTEGEWRVSDWWFHIEERTLVGGTPQLSG